MKKISTSSIDELKRTVPIVDVIEGYTHLAVKGTTFFGLCPFHNEKTGSLSVNPSLGLYHCFGCDASGDAITFIQNIDNISFIDAVETLANNYGITLYYDDNDSSCVQQSSESNAKREHSDIPVATLRAALECAKNYYITQLTSIVKNYLISRGINDNVIENYYLGFSPSENGVIQHLINNGFTTDTITTAGIGFYSKTTGKISDRMAYRIIFPITDSTGRTVAFAGRANPLDEPTGDRVKYVNTPNTSLYAKMTHLYGMSQAKKPAQISRQLCVCEGYFDVLALMSCDIPAVAVCGTTLSGAHINTIDRLLHDDHTYQVTLFFDNDPPGHKATSKAINLLLDDHQHLLEHYQAIHYSTIDSGTDPADIASKNQVLIKNLVSHSMPVINWCISNAMSKSYNIFHPGQRMLIAKNLSTTLAKITNKYTRCSYITHLAWQLNIPEEDITDLVASAKTKGKPMIDQNTHKPNIFDEIIAASSINARVECEKNITLLTLKYPHVFGHIYDSITEFSYHIFNDIKEAIAAIGGVTVTWQTLSSRADWLYHIADSSNGSVSREILTALVTLSDPDNVESYMTKGFIENMLQGFDCKELIDNAEMQLKTCIPHSKEYEEIIADIEVLNICLDDARNAIRAINSECKKKKDTPQEV